MKLKCFFLSITFFLYVMPSFAQQKCGSFDLLMSRGNDHYKAKPARYQDAINAYMAAMLDCPDKAKQAQDKIALVFREIEGLKNSAEKAKKETEKEQEKTKLALSESERQKNIAQTALLKQVEIYQENINEALNRFEIVEARVELAKIKQFSMNIVPQQTIVALEKQIADSLQKLLPEMVKVEGGQFIMGCKDKKMKVCRDNEKPAHQVIINNFSIGKYEVTQSLWTKIMGDNPSNFKNCDSCPVERVSWDKVQEFLKIFKTKTGLSFRLPTEAEWEYAASGGQFSKNYEYSGADSLYLVGWYNDSSTHPIGLKQANELGLYDMSGNVWEWCEDSYDEMDNFYETCKIQGIKNNPINIQQSNYKVLRGGSWGNNASSCRITHRDKYVQHHPTFNFGFRLAKSE